MARQRASGTGLPEESQGSSLALTLDNSCAMLVVCLEQTTSIAQELWRTVFQRFSMVDFAAHVPVLATAPACPRV